MSQQNPTIIVGHLDDSELTKSIDKLVSEVAKKTSGMAEDFTQAIDKMKLAMKDFAITQKVSVDLMKEAWRDMSKSFDAMVAAQSASTGGGKGSGKGKVYAPYTVGALEQEIAREKEKRREMQLGSDELDRQNILLEKRRKLLKEETSSPYQKFEKSFSKEFGAANSMSAKTLQQAEDKLKRLIDLQNRFKGTGLIDEVKMNRLQKAIDGVTDKITKLRNAKPKSLKEVLGMDANSIDQIAAKLRALKMVRIDPNNAAEVKQVGDAYAELKRKQAQLMGQNIQLTHSNNYLAQSFGYIRNRIVYALTLGAITNFVKQLYEIRGQYELLERSLGVLVGSFEKGTQIFNELNEMAIKSPFTLIELGTAAKQLTAYNFAANEVVDTTRRLADISAALGVPMERLTYNLGQIKAQGILNARDARDFANAGLAIVPMLAKMYTEQKTFGDEMVTTAQVYDMMSKKMVTYSDVLKVLYKVTDEGGKFFDFQAKQADTLRVQMANLTLAYNNMLNEIGSDNQGLLVGMVSGLKTLLANWKEISRVIFTLITTFGAYKATIMVVNALNSRMFVGRIIVNIMQYIKGIENATGAMATFNAVTKANPIAFLISALVAAIGYFALFNHKVKETTVEMERFGENASKQIKKVETLGKVLAGIEEGSSTYKKALSELNQIVSEYGVTEIKNRDEINSKIQQTIQLIKEEGKERQYANNISKGEERYLNATGEAKTSLNEGLMGLEGWFGTTSKVKKEILENTEAITDVASSIIEENIGLVVNKTGQEAYDGLIEIQNRVRRGLKNSGLSESAIDFILNKGYISAAIKDYRIATEEDERYNQKIKNYYDAATKATQSTMTFTEKVNANARALRNNTNDAVSLYNRVYDIVKIAKENHTINFDLKLSAEKPPKWMFDKSLPELQQLAERFTAIAQSGGHAKGYDQEGTYERGLMYASAARIKQEEEERNARNKDHKTKTKQSDEIAKAIKDEISLVKQLQSAYDTLTKKGDSHANAIAKVQDLYGKTIDLLNKDMDKFGLPRLDLSIIKGNNHNEVLAFFEKLRDVLKSKGLSNLERMEAVEGVVKEFRLKADTYNLDMITKGLNNELGKLKDEYELAVELDANPEMGNLFADWMGIDMSSLPHTAEEYAKRMTKALNKYLADEKSGIEIGSLLALTDDDLRMFQQRVDDGELTQAWVDNIVKDTKEARNALKKENSDIAKEWDNLVQKYSEYEYKIAQIQRNANKERKAFALKYGTNDQKERALALTTEIDTEKDQAKKQELINQLKQLLAEIAGDDDSKLKIKVAIDKKELEEGTKVAFEEFQKTPEWIVATGDLANISKSAIGMLINEIERYKKTAKGLAPKQIKQINSALSKLYKEQRKNNPFKAITNMLDEAKERMSAFDEDINKTQEEIDKLRKKQKEDKDLGIIDDKTQESLDKAINKLNKLKEKQEEVGKIDATSWVSGINELVAGVQSAVSVFNDLTKAIGGVNENNDVDELFSALKNVGSAAATGASIGGAWGAVIGAVAGGVASIITSLINSHNKWVDEVLKRSNVRVKELELAYIDLEHAVNKAYGAASIGAKKAAIANKKAQLTALEGQLKIEQLREAKNKDEEKIVDLQKKIKELQYDIEDSTDAIINDLLGISSVGDAATSVVKSMIDAFKRGEDYMKVFGDSFEDMIENLIINAIAGRVIGELIDEIWNDVDSWVNEEKANRANDIEHGGIGAGRNGGISGGSGIGYGRTGRTYDNSRTEDLITPERIEELRKKVENGEEKAKAVFDLMMELFNIRYGQDSNSQLSKLQQGIQSITEDTAGAIEAYMNGVSQQVYLHSDLLTQIRDTVAGFDMDVQTATQAQMLLQLQQSYAVQMSIESILQGVLNPSGRAFSVELLS